MEQIVDWLKKLGMSEYAPRFAENGIGIAALRHLTDQDLKEIGVLLGHRRIMLAAIAELARGAEPVAQPVVGSEARPRDGAERRQVTVMFSDLVGSTALSALMDPEDLREVISAYQTCVAETVRRFGGFVAKYMGDGVLVYFGYPQAHEDDAERAVRTGLEAIAAVGELKSSVPLQTRVGIATGLVVVGDLIGSGESQERGIIGETPNLAARLQGIAEPNEVVIAESTRRLLGDLFDLEDLGRKDLKGIAGPVPVWAALRPGSTESRFDALHGSQLTALVGREEELELLRRRWDQARSGDGRVVLVGGEPGIGKSRLTAAIAESLTDEPHTRLRYFCSPHHQDSALYPFIVQFERAAGFARDDTAEEKRAKLDALLAPGARDMTDLTLIAELLSLPNGAAELNLSPQRKRETLFDALLRQLETVSRRQSTLMVFEDIHWIDPTSHAVLDLIIDRLRSLPLLLIATFRPEFHPPWAGQPQVSILALNRLERRDQLALVTQSASGKALPDNVIDQIADRSDGVPLFVEELTKSVLESGLLREERDRYVLDRSLPPLAIPTTLHASLLARLDRLASVRLVAQTGAAIGREFSYELLRAVSPLSEEALQTSLDRLVASELVFQRGRPPDAVYAFKHALVRDAAHGSLLRSSRQRLHAHIAEALEAHFPELVDTQPELFAQHYGEAGLAEESVAYWSRAGHRSAARSAMAEAAAQLQKGLDQLALLPATIERSRQELEFRSSLGAVLLAVKGHAAPETGHAYARARELWEQLGSPSDFLQIPYGQSRHHVFLGELDLAQRFDEDLLRLGRQRNEPAGLVLGHYSSGHNLMLTGRFATSRTHLEQVRELYDAIPLRPLIRQVGDDPRINSQAVLGIVLFCLGYPAQGLARSNAAIADARKLAHPPSLASSLAFGSTLLWLARDNATLDERAGQLVAVATEQGFPLWGVAGTIHRGWVTVQNGEVAAGVSLLRSSVATYRANGAKAWMPYLLALLGKAYEIGGQIEESLGVLDDALQIADTTGVSWLSAEMNRLKGQVLLRQGQSGAAENLYRKALSIAEQQGAKLWELRAALSLARLWRDQGCQREARQLLSPIYAWFAEGLDTTDLKDAQTLLDELG